MSLMGYKNDLTRVEYDPDDRIFVGHLAGIADTVGFHGESVTELEAAFQAAVEDYLASCVKAGKAPDKPYSGRVMFRVNPATHARAALAAQVHGGSLIQWAEAPLARQAGADLARAEA